MLRTQGGQNNTGHTDDPAMVGKHNQCNMLVSKLLGISSHQSGGLDACEIGRRRDEAKRGGLRSNHREHPTQIRTAHATPAWHHPQEWQDACATWVRARASVCVFVCVDLEGE